MVEDQSKNFIEFIKKLSKPTIDPDEFHSISESIISIYGGGWRHSYAEVTRLIFVYNTDKDDINHILSGYSDNLNSFITEFENRIKPLENKKSKEDKELLVKYNKCHRSLEKLKDHIELELCRLNYSKSLEARLVTIHNTAKSKINKFDKWSKDVEDRLKSSENIIQNQRTESITILGVFSSIIAVLVAGVSLSSAIFANMHDISSWLLGAITFIIILFVSNTLFQLFKFLREIAEKDNKTDLPWWFNICLTLAILFCLYMHFYYYP